MPGRDFTLIVVIHIVFNLIFGGLFLLFSTSEARYESPDCVYLRFYSLIFAIVTLTAAVIEVFLLIFTFYESDVEEIYFWFYFIHSFASLFSLVFVFASLDEYESCGDLGELVDYFFLILICVFILIYICLKDQLNIKLQFVSIFWFVRNQNMIMDG